MLWTGIGGDAAITGPGAGEGAAAGGWWNCCGGGTGVEDEEGTGVADFAGRVAGPEGAVVVEGAVCAAAGGAADTGVGPALA